MSRDTWFAVKKGSKKVEQLLRTLIRRLWSGRKYLLAKSKEYNPPEPVAGTSLSGFTLSDWMVLRDTPHLVEPGVTVRDLLKSETT